MVFILDVLIGLAQAFIAIRMAWLGVIVTLHPPEVEADKRRIKREFWGWGIAACLLIVFVTYRGSMAQQGVTSQLAHIEKNTEQPPQLNVYPNVPPKHGRIAFLDPQYVNSGPNYPPYHDGDSVSMNTNFINMGDAPIKSSLQDAKVFVIKGDDLEKAFQVRKSELKPFRTGGVLNPSVNGLISKSYATWGNLKLDVTEARRLNEGDDALCVIAQVVWTDATGKYSTTFAECNRAEKGNGGFPWHVLAENDQETSFN